MPDWKNKWTLLAACCLALFGSGQAIGQLTAQALEAAVRGQQCRQIAAELEITPLAGEEMKFNGAICLYRNGEIGQALPLFREVQQMRSGRVHLAAFWVAKCHAALRHDSLALLVLQSIPLDALNHKMLAANEFERLSKTSPAFAALKKAVLPGFNCWTGVLAFVAGLGYLIGTALLLGRSRFTAGEKWLAVVMYSFSLILTCYLLIWTRYVTVFPYLQETWQFLTLLVGPSLFFYLKDTFKEDFTRKTVALHYLLPAISGLCTLPFFLQNVGLRTGVPTDVFVIGTSPFLLTGHLLFYAVQVHAMTQNEWQVDSNIKAWTKVVAGGMIAYTAAFLSYFVLVRCSFFNPAWDYAISFAMALGILAVGYMGLVQRRVFSSEPIGNFFPVKKYQTSSLTEGAGLSIKRQMERLLREEQVFKENELRLADLAAYLNISRHQLSQVINEHYGINFFELINQYRVEHVKCLLDDPAYHHHTIIQIAYEAGFNNKASFNRCFKKAVGLTPSAYRIRASGGQVGT